MLSEALGYPTEDDDWVGTFAIGSLLVVAGFLVSLVLFPVYGFLLAVVRAAQEGDAALPAFDDWKTLTVDGVKLFVVNVVYTGIPSVVFFAVLFVWFLGVFAIGANGDTGALALVGVGGLLVVLVVGAVWLVAAMLAPAALAHMVAEDDLGAAFDVRTLAGIARTRPYLVAVGLAWTVGFLIVAVGSLLAPLLVGVPVLFYGMVVTHHLFGQGYREGRAAAMGDQDGESPAAPMGDAG